MPKPDEAARDAFRALNGDTRVREHVGTTGARLNRGRLKAMKVKTALRSGGIWHLNHSRRALKVRSAVRAGGIDVQHNRNVR